MPVYETTVTDAANVPVAGAQGYIYVGGVLASLTDDLGAPLANPIVSDALGYAKATVPSATFTVKWRWLGKERLIETYLEGGIDSVLRTDLAANTGAALVGTTTGETVQERLDAFVTPEIFGAIGDGDPHPLSERYASLAAAQAVYPFATALTQQIDYCAIVAAITSQTFTSHGSYYHSGPEVRLKDGAVYYMGADTLQLKRSVRIRGAGSGLPWTSMAALKFAAGATGIVVHRYNTIGATTESPVTTGADGSVLEGFRLLGTVGAADSLGGHGIWLRARAICRDLYVSNFRGNGYHIVATAGGSASEEGNANCFQIHGGRVQGCENGIFADGADANAGVAVSVDVSGNRRWGIWDSSFLGNTYVAIHCDDNGDGIATDGQSAFASYGGNSYQAVPTASAANLVGTQPGTNSAIWYPIASVGTRAIAWTGSQPAGTYRHGGPFYTDNANGRCSFFGPYIESGHGVSYLSPVTAMIGGIWEQPMSGGAIRVSNGLYSTNTGYVSSGVSSGGKTIEAGLGGDATSGDIIRFSHSDDNAAWPWRLRRAGADWVMDNAASGSRIAFMLTGELTGNYFGTSVTQPYLFNAPTIVLGSGANGRRQTTGTAAPTTGAWAKGDIVWNIDAAAGGKVGWVCVTAGSPGTWKPFGAIDA